MIVRISSKVIKKNKLGKYRSLLTNPSFRKFWSLKMYKHKKLFPSTFGKKSQFKPKSKLPSSQKKSGKLKLKRSKLLQPGRKLSNPSKFKRQSLSLLKNKS